MRHTLEQQCLANEELKAAARLADEAAERLR